MALVGAPEAAVQEGEIEPREEGRGRDDAEGRIQGGAPLQVAPLILAGGVERAAQLRGPSVNLALTGLPLYVAHRDLEANELAQQIEAPLHVDALEQLLSLDHIEA